MSPEIKAITGNRTRNSRCYQISYEEDNFCFIWPDSNDEILSDIMEQTTIAHKLGLKDAEELREQLDSGKKFKY